MEQDSTVLLLNDDNNDDMVANADALDFALPARMQLITYPPHVLAEDPHRCASSYFAPLAGMLRKPRSALVAGGWMAYGGEGARRIGPARQRLLERVALTLGAVGVSSAPGNDPPAVFGAPGYTHVPGWRLKAQERDRRDLICAETAAIQQAFRPGLLGPGSGSWMPGRSVVLVGDRAVNAYQGDIKHRLPFFSFSDTGCSLWLAEQLNELGVDETQLYWINGYDRDSRVTNDEFLDRLKPSAVVGLGRAAGKWVREAKKKRGWLNVRYAEHPRHHRNASPTKTYDLLPILWELTRPS